MPITPEIAALVDLVERISATDVTDEEIQEAGEDLGTLLGRVLETKMFGRRILYTLEELR